MKKIWLVFAMALLSFAMPNKKVNVYLIGDSTMANKPIEDNPERGWGMVVNEFFQGNVTFFNHAMNGRSSKSFIEEGRWDSVFYKLHKGDYVFIQFGHNDQKFNDSTRFTVPEKDYRQNLIRFVRETRAQGAIPVLLTSICRRKFDEAGNLVDTHANYPTEMKKVAQELSVPMIDMEQKSKKIVQTYGVEASKKIYLWIEPGKYNRLPDGKQDDTHFSEFGARIMAGLVVEGINENNLELVKFLKNK